MRTGSFGPRSPTRSCDRLEHPARRPHRTETPAAARTKVTRVLLILTYWTAKHPAITPAQAKKLVITEPDAWYRSASYGRQGLSGTATSWVRIPKPSCGSFQDGSFQAAERAAKRYHPAHYDRIILYEPCTLEGGAVGLGSEPGNQVILGAGGLSMPVSVHEQGHNYGLDHANQLACSRGGRPATESTRSRCQVSEYNDLSSAMAYEWDPRYAGDFTAPQKAQLGWLTGHLRTVTRSGTVTLAPYETKPGVKAIRVPGPHHRTYWVEFRTRRGNDTHLPAPYIGVLIHQSSARTGLNASVQVDSVPPNRSDSTFDQQTTPAYLPAHSSWTTPDGIRFTVDSQSSRSARVTITRGQRTSAPGAVRGVTTRVLDRAAAVDFHPPAHDGGLPVTSYTITASPGGAHRTVRAYESASTVSGVVPGLANGTGYRFTVRATNERGTGAATGSALTTPRKLYPTPIILSPSAGDSVHDVVPIKIEARHVAGGSPIEQMDVTVDHDIDIDTVYGGARTTVSWDTTNLALGSHTIHLTATDKNGRTRSTSVVVTLTQTTGPVLTLTGPSTSTGLRGTVKITGTVTPNPVGHRAVTDLEVFVDGGGVAELQNPASSWSTTLPTEDYTPGSHVISVSASDRNYETSVAQETVTIAASEQITLTAPTTGSNVHGNVHFTGTVTNYSSQAGLTVEVTDKDGNYYGEADLDTARGASDAFDIAVDVDGYNRTLHLLVTVTSMVGQSVGAPVTVLAGDVASTITLTAPTTSTISGTTTLTAAVGNNSGVDDPQIEIDIDGSPWDYDTVEAPAGGSGTYSIDFDTTGYPNGAHTFTFTLTDVNGPVVVTRKLTIAN